MPFMDEDPMGKLSSNVAKYGYGSILRWARQLNIRHKYDKEPEWRHPRAELTTGYQKRF
jgi:hydrogenase small subunit